VNRVFLDTLGLIAVVNIDDQWHSQAESTWQELLRANTSFLTTSLVLIEVADGLSRIHQRTLAVNLCDRLRNSPQVEIVQVIETTETRAWDLFRERQDKEWGMTDCVSFVVMRDRDLQEAFTNDRHFEQAGFVRLLRAQ
jgi:predicted nucleic acid-binding protein